MVEMSVSRIGMNQQGQALVILSDLPGERLLPIWIGMFEAHAIAIEMQGEPFERPLTHDLFNNVLAALGHRLEKIEVTKLEDGVFYAVLYIVDGGRVVQVDSRPSDAIALALRAKARIFVAEFVLDEAQVLMSDISESDDEVEKFRALMEKAELARGGSEDSERRQMNDEPDDQ